MILNQRPLEDYYEYAKKIARLDFLRRSGSATTHASKTSRQRVKDAAVRHAVPGRFVPLVGFECGTPPDDSHRCVLFRDPARCRLSFVTAGRLPRSGFINGDFILTRSFAGPCRSFTRRSSVMVAS